MPRGPLTVPSAGRLNRLALDIVEDARQRADAAAIKPGPEVRLALAVLMITRAADRYEVQRFWDGLTRPPFDASTGGVFRANDLNYPLEAWRRNAEKRG